MTVSARLAELGITLPAVAVPLASYVPAVRTGNLVYTAGQLPTVSGNLTHDGKVGADVTPEDARVAARTCALNALAAIDSVVGIDNDPRGQGGRIVASAPGFTGQPGVVNGASELLGEVFGEAASTRVRRSGLRSCRWMHRWKSSSSSKWRDSSRHGCCGRSSIPSG